MNEILTIETFDMTRLRNSEFFMFASEVEQIVKAEVDKAPSPAPTTTNSLTSLYNLYKSEVEELDKAVIKLNKKQLTDPIADADNNRDMVYHGFTLFVRAYSYSTDPEHRESAHNLQVLLDNYGDVRRRPYVTQSSDMINLLQDINAYHTSDINTLHADFWMDVMKTTNNDFIKLMDDRFNENVEQLSEEVRTVRLKVGHLYYKITSLIESGNLISNGDLYVELIHNINERVAYYKTTLAIRKGRAEAKKKKEDLEE